MARWLVTGGVGFIGHHLSRALVARGDTVHVLDDFSDAPYPTRLKRLHAETLAKESGDRFSVTEGCVTDRELARRLTDGVSGVIHLAGLAGVRPSFADPARYAAVNVEGTATLMDAAQKAGVKTFAFASSSSVYGNSTPLPATEDAPAIDPESPYAATKRACELVASALARKTPEMRCPALRFFTVYGPWQRPEMAITSFLRSILKGEPITVFGDGSMKRDFTHVDDIVRGVLAAVDRAPAGVRPYNLGSGAPITLNDLVAAMGRASGSAPKVERAPVPLGDVEATFADIARAKTELGWAPRVRLEDGLATVVAWLRREG
ncbi:MAG: GDP-mannose 4,6-dehydratase [Labilithrix sp.]|nr:GDP-mannose 4,6-dehydratase [Labilithrix sp.]MCW5814443.1 GDP-mannose 4,6-dehydratase [Labilithrix sp.]